MIRYILSVALFFLFQLSAHALEVPTIENYVTDHANALSASEEDVLNARLKEYEEKTSNQIFILIISSLEGEDLEGYANEVFRSIGVGQEEKNNGVLILHSTGDRKIRIEVGYGLEGRLTDAMSGRIIDGEMIPHFKDGNFYQGYTNALGLMEKIIANEYVAGNIASDGSVKDRALILLFTTVGFIFAGILGMRYFLFGGLFGGVVGALIGFFFFSPTALVVSWCAVIGLVVGLFARYVLIFLMENGSGGGSYGGGSSSGGGHSSSSSGFSGGGGGSSGGGGASGDY